MCVSSFPYSSGNNASFQCFCPPSKSVTQNIVYSFLLASSSCQMPVLRWKLSSCKITSCFIPVLNYFVCGTFCIFTTCAKTRSDVKTFEFLNLSLFHLSLINVFNSVKLVIGRPGYLWVVGWDFFPSFQTALVEIPGLKAALDLFSIILIAAEGPSVFYFISASCPNTLMEKKLLGARLHNSFLKLSLNLNIAINLLWFF